MTVFKAKQLKGKLIFSCEEDEWRYLCWTVLSRGFEEHDMIGPYIFKVYNLGKSTFLCIASYIFMSSLCEYSSFLKI